MVASLRCTGVSERSNVEESSRALRLRVSLRVYESADTVFAEDMARRYSSESHVIEPLHTKTSHLSIFHLTRYLVSIPIGVNR